MRPLLAVPQFVVHVSLSSIDRSWSSVYLTFGFGKILGFLSVVVEKRTVNALNILLVHRSFPDFRQSLLGWIIANPGDIVFNYFQILACLWENLHELFVSSLEDAVGRVVRAVDDLDVLHKASGESLQEFEVRRVRKTAGILHFVQDDALSV